jgi:hypothetical protein
MTDLEAENRHLKEKVKSLEETVAAISKLYEEKVMYAEEEGTHQKLRAIQSQIAEVVENYEERMRAAINAARTWGKEHKMIGCEEMLGIVERALPRR